MTQKQNSNLPAIIVCILLFGMISFVTNLASPMGGVLENQFSVAKWMGTLGVFANFIAYAIMGIPAGNILQKKGYKFTALIAVGVGFAGVGVQTIAGLLTGNLAFGVYLLGAFIAGFSMCMLNLVVNPMLNKLAGGGNRGNQLVQIGGSFNSLMATAVIFLSGIFVPNVITAKISDVFPLMFIALGIFALAFVVLLLTKIPENPAVEAQAEEKSQYGPMSFRHFVLGAIAIFIYVGIEVGIPKVLQDWLNLDLRKVENVVATEDGKLVEVIKKGLEVEKDAVIAKILVEKKAEVEGVETVTHDTVFVKAPVKAVVTPCLQVKDGKEVFDENYIKVGEEVKQGQQLLGLDSGFAGPIAASVTAVYWLLMLVGRLLGAALGAKVSAKTMLTTVSLVGLALVLSAMFIKGADVTLPVFKGVKGFGTENLPISAALLVLCGLCTSVMWGGIFNLAVEGLGKYTEKGAGIFMAMVCGGGILPLLQNAVVDWTGSFSTSYIVIVAGLIFLLYYALVGSKNVNKNIPTE